MLINKGCLNHMNSNKINNDDSSKQASEMYFAKAIEQTL